MTPPLNSLYKDGQPPSRNSRIDDVQITVTQNEDGPGDRRGPAHKGRFTGNFVSRNIRSSAKSHRTEIEKRQNKLFTEIEDKELLSPRAGG